MTRVLMATHPWGVIQDKYGNGRSGLTATFANADSSPATHWSALTGGTSSTGSVATDARGRLMRWIESGIYTMTVDGESLEVHATPGSVEGRVEDLEAGGGGGGAVGTLPPLFLATTLSGQGNNPYWLKVRASDEVLFAPINTDGIVKSYDLTVNPPVVLDTVGVGIGTAYISIFGNYLFVTDQSDLKLRVIDATDPANMSLVTTYTYSSGGTGGGRSGINTAGTQMLIGGPEAGVNDNKAYLLDISNPLSISELDTLVTGVTHRGAVYLGAYLGDDYWAITSRDDHKVMILKWSGGNLSEVGSVTSAGDTATPLAFNNGTLYVGMYSNPGYLDSWDLSNPSVPPSTPLDHLLIGEGSEQIDISGNYAYVALRASNKLVRVDISDPSNMSLAGELIPGGTITPGVAVHDGYAYLTAAGDTTNGKIYKIAIDPSVEVLASALHDQVTSLDVAVPKLSSVNTFPAAQTFSAAQGIRLTNAAPGILFGNDELRQLSDNTGRWDVVLTTLGMIAYGAGALLRFKVAEGDAEWAFSIDGSTGKMLWSDRTAAPDCRLERQGANNLQLIATDFSIGTAGRGFKVKEGSNAKQGVSTLVAGSVVVANTSVTATSRIFLTVQSLGTVTVPKSIAVTARSVGTSFTITSEDATDTSVVAWEMFQVAP